MPKNRTRDIKRSISIAALVPQNRRMRRLAAFVQNTDYPVLQVNGQRLFGGPPPGWNLPQPSRGSEVFVGKLPRDCYEDELVPLFERCGTIYELRLMMDFSGTTRGYCFVMYATPKEAILAIRMLDGYEIRPGRRIGVVLSVNNCRLFIGPFPSTKREDEITEVLRRLTEGVTGIRICSKSNDVRRNHSKYVLVEYNSHRSAAMARRTLIPERMKLWGRHITVDWAAVTYEDEQENTKSYLDPLSPIPPSPEVNKEVGQLPSTLGEKMAIHSPLRKLVAQQPYTTEELMAASLPEMRMEAEQLLYSPEHSVAPLRSPPMENPGLEELMASLYLSPELCEREEQQSSKLNEWMAPLYTLPQNTNNMIQPRQLIATLQQPPLVGQRMGQQSSMLQELKVPVYMLSQNTNNIIEAGQLIVPLYVPPQNSNNMIQPGQLMATSHLPPLVSQRVEQQSPMLEKLKPPLYTLPLIQPGQLIAPSHSSLQVSKRAEQQLSMQKELKAPSRVPSSKTNLVGNLPYTLEELMDQMLYGSMTINKNENTGRRRKRPCLYCRRRQNDVGNDIHFNPAPGTPIYPK